MLYIIQAFLLHIITHDYMQIIKYE